MGEAYRLTRRSPAAVGCWGRGRVIQGCPERCRGLIELARDLVLRRCSPEPIERPFDLLRKPWLIDSLSELAKPKRRFQVGLSPQLVEYQGVIGPLCMIVTLQ